MSILNIITNGIATDHVFFGVFFFIIGCCLASFFNVIVFRLPKIIDNENYKQIKEWFNEKGVKFPLEDQTEEISLSSPPSHCYSCKTTIKWYHNLPIIGYLVLGGKCGSCKTPYSAQYLILEFLGGAIFLASYLSFIQYGIPTFLLASTLLMTCFLLIAIDIKTLTLPDQITLPLLWLGLLACAFGYSVVENISAADSIIGAVCGYLVLWVISKAGELLKGQEVMGGGDLKLLAALGAFIGYKGVIFTAFLSPFPGIITWLILKAFKSTNAEIPYGPSLMVTAVIYIYYGKDLALLIGLKL